MTHNQKFLISLAILVVLFSLTALAQDQPPVEGGDTPPTDQGPPPTDQPPIEDHPLEGGEQPPADQQRPPEGQNPEGDPNYRPPEGQGPYPGQDGQQPPFDQGRQPEGQNFQRPTTGPGNCQGQEQCQLYCGVHPEECQQWAGQQGVQRQGPMNGGQGYGSERRSGGIGGPQCGTPEECRGLAQEFGVANSIGVRTGPSGCTSEEECKKIFDENPQEVRQWAQQNGMIEHKGQFIEARAGPGGCSSPEECMTYCRENPESCDQFAGRRGQGFEQAFNKIEQRDQRKEMQQERRKEMRFEGIPREIIEAGAETEFVQMMAAMAKFRTQRLLTELDKMEERISLAGTELGIQIDGSKFSEMKTKIETALNDLGNVTNAEEANAKMKAFFEIMEGPNGVQGVFENFGQQMQEKVQVLFDEKFKRMQTLQEQMKNKEQECRTAGDQMRQQQEQNMQQQRQQQDEQFRTQDEERRRQYEEQMRNQQGQYPQGGDPNYRPPEGQGPYPGDGGQYPQGGSYPEGSMPPEGGDYQPPPEQPPASNATAQPIVIQLQEFPGPQGPGPNDFGGGFPDGPMNGGPYDSGQGFGGPQGPGGFGDGEMPAACQEMQTLGTEMQAIGEEMKALGEKVQGVFGKPEDHEQDFEEEPLPPELIEQQAQLFIKVFDFKFNGIKQKRDEIAGQGFDVKEFDELIAWIISRKEEGLRIIRSGDEEKMDEFFNSMGDSQFDWEDRIRDSIARQQLEKQISKVEEFLPKAQEAINAGKERGLDTSDLEEIYGELKGLVENARAQLSQGKEISLQDFRLQLREVYLNFREEWVSLREEAARTGLIVLAR
ncbi:MAG: hypothetical protein Q7S92_03770 [Candidatus Diapherotrites archaeon]|nr:hypothetical protein [Candidatus Diapherotrites archaeon]